jgi:hypothetical protein
MHNISKYIYSFLLFANALFAVGNEDIITTNIKALSWGGNIKNIYYKPSQDESIDDTKIHLFTSKLTPSLPYEGPRDSFFYIRKKNSDGSFKNIPIAKFKLLPNAKDQLLIVFKNTQGLSQVLVYDNSLDIFKQGQMRFYNFTKQNVAMKINQNIYPSHPMESIVIDYPSNKQNTSVEFSKLYKDDDPINNNETNKASAENTGKTRVSDSIQIGVQQEGKWLAAFRSSMSRNPEEKVHFFIFPYREKYYKVQYIQERISSAPQAISNEPK